MNKITDDVYYQKIKKKFDEEIFLGGNLLNLSKKYYVQKSIHDFPIEERTPEVCSSLINYGKCRFSDVPKKARTKEFFIHSFTDSDVFYYIKNHIDQFDRQFFKDLIVSNSFATEFQRNAFSIMPLSYIDEEMCSLAMLSSLDWVKDGWLYSVSERKKDALTGDLWKLGARLYAKENNGSCKYLETTPSIYKDPDYYKEMCLCCFNCGNAILSPKRKIMNFLPKEILTQSFLFSLIKNDPDSITSFDERGLETVVSYPDSNDILVQEKLWQFIVKNNGFAIQDIPLNEERIGYFLCHYPVDSSPYQNSFKENYSNYQKNYGTFVYTKKR